MYCALKKIMHWYSNNCMTLKGVCLVFKLFLGAKVHINLLLVKVFPNPKECQKGVKFNLFPRKTKAYYCSIVNCLTHPPCSCIAHFHELQTTHIRHGLFFCLVCWRERVAIVFPWLRVIPTTQTKSYNKDLLFQRLHYFWLICDASAKWWWHDPIHNTLAQRP